MKRAFTVTELTYLTLLAITEPPLIDLPRPPELLNKLRLAIAHATIAPIPRPPLPADEQESLPYET